MANLKHGGEGRRNQYQSAKTSNEVLANQISLEKAAEAMANLKLGDNQFKKKGTSNEGPSSSISVEKAAEVMKIGKSSVERARAAN